MFKNKMRLTIIAILIFIFSFSKGQQLPNDSLTNIYLRGLDYLRQGAPEIAEKAFTKIIQSDSSYYKIYYMRGFNYLWEFESSLIILDSNGSNFDRLDSSFIELGIKDLKKCIQLKFSNPKNFPDEITWFDTEYKIPEKSHSLDEIGLREQDQSIIDGVLVYITSNGKNKKLACDCWQKALDMKVHVVDILMNEFCK
jgi:hypothetical protein